MGLIIYLLNRPQALLESWWCSTHHADDHIIVWEPLKGIEPYRLYVRCTACGLESVGIMLSPPPVYKRPWTRKFWWRGSATKRYVLTVVNESPRAALLRFVRKP